MMQEVVELQIGQFALIYLLLLIVLFVMRKCRIHQTKLLFVASIRMTVQLVLAGLILTYIFEYPHPIFTVLYFVVMTGFAIHRVLSKNKGLNRRFQWAIACSLTVSGQVGGQAVLGRQAL